MNEPRKIRAIRDVLQRHATPMSQRRRMLAVQQLFGALVTQRVPGIPNGLQRQALLNQIRRLSATR